MEPCLHFPYILVLYTKKTLHLHNTEIFYSEFYSVRRERVVFSDEAERWTVGSIASGITSPTSEVLLWTRQYVCDRQTYFIVKIICLCQRELRMIGNHLSSFQSYIYNCRDEQVYGIGINEWIMWKKDMKSGYSVFESDLVVNLIRIKGDSHCTIIIPVQVLTTLLFHE